MSSYEDETGVKLIIIIIIIHVNLIFHHYTTRLSNFVLQERRNHGETVTFDFYQEGSNFSRALIFIFFRKM